VLLVSVVKLVCIGTKNDSLTPGLVITFLKLLKINLSTLGTDKYFHDVMRSLSFRTVRHFTCLALLGWPLTSQILLWIQMEYFSFENTEGNSEGGFLHDIFRNPAVTLETTAKSSVARQTIYPLSKDEVNQFPGRKALPALITDHFGVSKRLTVFAI